MSSYHSELRSPKLNSFSRQRDSVCPKDKELTTKLPNVLFRDTTSTYTGTTVNPFSDVLKYCNYIDALLISFNYIGDCLGFSVVHLLR